MAITLTTISAFKLQPLPTCGGVGRPVKIVDDPPMERPVSSMSTTTDGNGLAKVQRVIYLSDYGIVITASSDLRSSHLFQSGGREKGCAIPH